MAAVADLRLQAVVIGDAEVHQHVDLAHAAVHRQDGTGGIGRGHGPHLPGRGAIEGRRGVQIDACGRGSSSAGARSRPPTNKPFTISRSAPIDTTWLRGFTSLSG